MVANPNCAPTADINTDPDTVAETQTDQFLDRVEVLHQERNQCAGEKENKWQQKHEVWVCFEEYNSSASASVHIVWATSRVTRRIVRR